MKEILKESIKMHYDNKDYTEVVRDAILCLMSEIRKKSDLQNSDGVDLINKAFSEKNPIIKINKMQTETEKNKQKGVMNMSKGLVEYFRNPMSHSKQNYTKKVADAILVIVDEILLEEISQSKSLNSIEELYLEAINDLSPSTSRYAKIFVNSIPNNKEYELLIELFNNRNELKKEKMIIVNELIKKITKEEFDEYCSNIEKELYGQITEDSIINLLKFISDDVWINLSDFCKTEIEELVFEDINNCKIYIDYYTNEDEIKVEKGNIFDNSLHIINNFSNKIDIYKIIYKKMDESKENEEIFDYYIEKYFKLIINYIEPETDMIQYIENRLSYINDPIWKSSMERCLKEVDISNKWKRQLHIFGLNILKDDELPF